ncbi:MAG: YbjN domain-containing protein [Deltaproteobacteria bacterium]|nr:YbjN domain-containing protein [Deltaproteobacteria bacterium]
MVAAAGLFDNQREVNLTSTITMIEDVLVELGHFLNDCRDDRAGSIRSWRVRKGSATVRISLVDRPDFTHVVIASAVMKLDGAVDRDALFTHLLRENAELTGAAFALAGDVVLLRTERSTLDLDRSEVQDLIARVQTYADDHDDRLVAIFGGTLGGELR